MSTRWIECPASARLRRGLRPRARRGVAIERDVPGKFPIAGPDIAGPGDRAVLDVERVDIDAEPLRRCCEKDLANFGAGVAQRAAGLLDREAARRDALVRACGRRCADHLDAADRSTSSSSAAICASAVTMPWPISTLPGETVTWPVAENFTQDDNFGLAARLTGSLGGDGAGACWFITSPSLPPRAAPPAPCDCAIRSGTGCGRAPPSPRASSATDFASAAPPR